MVLRVCIQCESIAGWERGEFDCLRVEGHNQAGVWLRLDGPALLFRPTGRNRIWIDGLDTTHLGQIMCYRGSTWEAFWIEEIAARRVIEHLRDHGYRCTGGDHAALAGWASGRVVLPGDALRGSAS